MLRKVNQTPILQDTMQNFRWLLIQTQTANNPSEKDIGIVFVERGCFILF